MLNCGLLQGTKEEKISSGVFMEESTLRVTDEQGKGCRSRKTRPQALEGVCFPVRGKMRTPERVKQIQKVKNIRK